MRTGECGCGLFANTVNEFENVPEYIGVRYLVIRRGKIKLGPRYRENNENDIVNIKRHADDEDNKCEFIIPVFIYPVSQ